jgi:hypothetical protein
MAVCITRGILAADVDSFSSGIMVPANKPTVRKSGNLVHREKLCITNTTFHAIDRNEKKIEQNWREVVSNI